MMKTTPYFLVFSLLAQQSMAGDETYTSLTAHGSSGHSSSHSFEYNALNSISHAGNWLTIEQVGDGNTANVEQVGNQHRTQLTQNGHSNQIKLIQKNDGDYTARIDQQGDGNYAELVQQNYTQGGYTAIYQQGGRSITVLEQQHEFIEIYQD